MLNLHQLLDLGITKVLNIGQTRFQCFFESKETDVNQFFKKTIVEIRITIGDNWNNSIFTTRGPLLTKLSQTSFRRGSEMSFDRNVIFFNENLQCVNLRMSIGACKEFETETS